MNKVNLFIVGAAKCGTTSLHSYLDGHPQICMSSVKEPNFFSWQSIEEQRLYYKGENHVKSLNAYNHLFHCSEDAQVFGEASVSYLFYPGTAQKIKEYNPDAKIIILLRDPSKRAFSHYLMDRRLGFVKEDIMTIFSNPEKFPLHHQQVFELGLYSRQVKEYLDTFGKDNVMIILSDELNRKRTEVLQKVYSFLGVGSYLSEDTNREHNIAGKGNNAVIRTLYQFRSLRKITSYLLPESIRERMKRLLFSKKPDVLAEKEYEVFRSYYHNDIVQLEQLIGLDLSGWRD